MFPRLSKATLALFAMLVTLPATAAERHFDHRFSRHQGFNDGLFLGRRTHWDSGLHFTRGNAIGYRPRSHLLKRFDYPSANRYGRNNIVVIASQPQTYDPPYGSNGLYSGSSYAYQTDGGTYVGGDGFYRVAEPARELAPKAKVIDIGIADDPCSYEANVCVIRP